LGGTGGGGTGTGLTAQPATSSAASTAVTLECGNAFFPIMWLILLEAALALGLLVFIVWWTMHKPRKPPAKKD
jgi:hypothetical protein